MKLETLQRYYEMALDFGYEAAAEKLGIKKETLRRKVREYKKLLGASADEIDDNLTRQLYAKFSKPELRNILRSGSTVSEHKPWLHDFSGDVFTVGLLTDTHLGSNFTDPRLIYEAFEVFAAESVDCIMHCGDVHEGMSGRAGHMYECSHLGYSAQLDHSREVFSKWTDTEIFMIDGNHDRWFIKSNGALVVKELDLSLGNVHFLGHDEGDFHVGPIWVKLWHGEDGSSYAFSYRIQKLVESLTGGEKPNILFCGHTHKAFSMFDRHIHCVSAGAMQYQSKWMRSKKHASHTGFHVVKFGFTEKGVSWFEARWYPFYL